MTLPAWIMKLAAAAVIPVMVGIGAALSAPSPATDEIVLDEDYAPGELGVDFAAITGPVGSREGRVPACADPARKGDLRDCLK